MITLNGNNPDLLGLSTDTKPTDAGVNTLFLEVDTATFYYFDGSDWTELGQAPSADDLGKGVLKLSKGAEETEPETVDEPEQLETVEEEPVVEVKKTTTRKKKTTTTEEVTGDGESK